MIVRPYGPEPAPASYYVGQATLEQAIEQLKISAKFVFWAVTIVHMVFIAAWWVASALDLEGRFNSLVSVHVSSEGKMVIFLAAAAWWLHDGRKRGLSWTEIGLGVLLAVPPVGIMMIIPPWEVSPCAISYWIVLTAWSSAWDDLYRAGREKCELRADLERRLTAAEAELSREWKARAAFYGREW